METYDRLTCKGAKATHINCYTTMGISCMIHTLSNVLRFLFLSDLKKDGVSPVIFLNWLDKWETLL